MFMLSLYGIIYVTWYTRHLSPVFQHLPEPNSMCLLQGLVGVENGARFRYTRSRDYQTPTRHALLGSGSSWALEKRTSSLVRQTELASDQVYMDLPAAQRTVHSKSSVRCDCARNWTRVCSADDEPVVNIAARCLQQCQL